MEEEDEWSDAPGRSLSSPRRPDPQPMIDDQVPSSPAPPDCETKSTFPDPNPPPPAESFPATVAAAATTTTTTDLPDTDDSDDPCVHKKQKTLSSLTPDAPVPASAAAAAAPLAPPPPLTGSKKSSKKKNNSNVWAKSTSRKGKKKSKSATTRNAPTAPEDTVHITPVPRFPDRSDDSPDAAICLSRVCKAEKVDLSEDRLSAGSTKGYRMVRATRGVNEGAWYFEIKVVKLGETGHTRLGWTTDKGDLQAPVGYDMNSYGYRDIDGSKVHKSLREKYGEVGYLQGDVIGFYIYLPDGSLYAPKPPLFVWYKGQKCMRPADGKEETLKIVPGSEVSFFKNGICQGVAFTDLPGGRYYPAASMYTLPNQPNCEVRFNFGPDFDFFPQDFGDRPPPRPMIEVPYHGYDGRVEGAVDNGVAEKKN